MLAEALDISKDEYANVEVSCWYLLVTFTGLENDLPVNVTVGDIWRKSEIVTHIGPILLFLAGSNCFFK